MCPVLAYEFSYFCRSLSEIWDLDVHILDLDMQIQDLGDKIQDLDIQDLDPPAAVAGGSGGTKYPPHTTRGRLGWWRVVCTLASPQASAGVGSRVRSHVPAGKRCQEAQFNRWPFESEQAEDNPFILVARILIIDTIYTD